VLSHVAAVGFGAAVDAGAAALHDHCDARAGCAHESVVMSRLRTLFLPAIAWRASRNAVVTVSGAYRARTRRPSMAAALRSAVSVATILMSAAISGAGRGSITKPH